MLTAYKDIAGEEIIDQLQELAESLQKVKITHVNSTAKGGGVAEILATMVPLMRALGIDARWEVIQGSADFFHCTKQFHNGLQGLKTVLSAPYLKARPLHR